MLRGLTQDLPDHDSQQRPRVQEKNRSHLQGPAPSRPYTEHEWTSRHLTPPHYNDQIQTFGVGVQSSTRRSTPTFHRLPLFVATLPPA